jgi:Arc/MetJ family transcription regulator
VKHSQFAIRTAATHRNVHQRCDAEVNCRHFEERATMRTTLTLDDELFEAASAAIGVSDRSVVLHEALKSLVQREAARRLAKLGGSEPRVAPAPRRRQLPASRTRSRAK